MAKEVSGDPNVLMGDYSKTPGGGTDRGNVNSNQTLKPGVGNINVNPGPGSGNASGGGVGANGPTKPNKYSK